MTPALPQQGVALDPANFSVLAVLPTFTHAGLRLEFSVSSVSPIPVEGFSLNFGQMFALVRRYAESITQPCQLKVKVTVQGHGFEH